MYWESGKRKNQKTKITEYRSIKTDVYYYTIYVPIYIHIRWFQYCSCFIQMTIFHCCKKCCKQKSRNDKEWENFFILFYTTIKFIILIYILLYLCLVFLNWFSILFEYLTNGELKYISGSTFFFFISCSA